MAKKDVVYNKFPIPLINRMEKHFLEMSSGLTEPQKQVTEKLKAWVEDFAKIFLPIHEGKRFKDMRFLFTYIKLNKAAAIIMCMSCIVLNCVLYLVSVNVQSVRE